MEHYQIVIIDLLKAAINKEKIAFDEENNIYWDEVVKEAKQHKISALIYSSIDRNSLKYINSNILYKWKQEIFRDNLIQIKHISSIVKLIDDLNQQGIEIMLLKGLVLRNFYPRPEYRTMSDIDILVKPKDYLTVKNYLIRNGYKCDESNHPIHQSFICYNQPAIEVHWRILNNDNFNGSIKDFEDCIWKNSIEFNICGVNSKTLCDEDFLIHMCLHMAVHAKYRGFGMRQLYDMRVFIENKNIDWVSFSRRISSYGISKFTKGLFVLLNQIFNLNIPIDTLGEQCITRKQVQMLLNNIFESGVHGKDEEKNGFGQLDQYSGKQKNVSNNIKILFKFIFPTRAELSCRYKYAQASVFLLPIVWVHHAFRGIFIRKYGFFKMIKYYNSTLNHINRRKELIKIFEL